MPGEAQSVMVCVREEGGREGGGPREAGGERGERERERDNEPSCMQGINVMISGGRRHIGTLCGEELGSDGAN